MNITDPQLRRLMAMFLTKTLEKSENRQKRLAVTIKTLEDEIKEMQSTLDSNPPVDLDEIVNWARVREEVQESYNEATDMLLTINASASSLRASLVRQRRILIACASSEEFATVGDEVEAIVDKWFSASIRKRTWSGTKDEFLDQLTEDALDDLLK